MGNDFVQSPGSTSDVNLPQGSDDLLTGTNLEFLRNLNEQSVDSVLGKLGQVAAAPFLGPLAIPSIVAWFVKALTKVLADMETEAVAEIAPVVGLLVQSVVKLLLPVAGFMGDLSGQYVQMIAGGLGTAKGGDAANAGAAAGIAAGYAYDHIVAPLALITSNSDPSKAGTGLANVQKTLGGIVSAHLITWVVNVISNLTGVGALKFINSFNEVITSALNARSMSRLCMKPYMDTFITKPSTNELNSMFALNHGSAAGIIKEYLRGGLTADAMRVELRKLGYNDDVVAQLLMDTAKELTLTDISYLVRSKSWTEDQALTYLYNTGWDALAANVALFRETNALVFDLQKRTADALGSHYAKRELREPEFRDTLGALGFTDAETDAYVVLYGVELEFFTQLTYTQVIQLFNESLISLSDVQDFLTLKGNSPESIDLLLLLDFTAADQRQARKAALGAAARLAAIKAEEESTAKAAQGQADLAAAYAALAAKKAALAKSLGQ